ncbi:MAG: hypothetical protein H6719_00170, partial [Sandaracinaceae bacterium]|nr:hypothetical protein [Sandaracinaceae bacterium]
WTARERNNFAWAWFPFVFFGLQGFVGGVGGAFAIATDPARSADPRAWAPVALVPAAGPWIRLLDPGIDDYAAPVAMAVASTLGLTALIAGIALLVELVDRGSRANRRRSSY